MAKKVVDRRKEKEKREKIFLGIGVVLLVGVLAIQGPKLMGKGSKPAAATTSAVVTGLTDTTAIGTGPVPAAGLASPAATFVAGPGQLASLSLFAQKDPFKQQGGGQSTTGGSSSGSTGRTTTNPIPPTTTGRTGKTATTPTATGPESLYLSAVISVNGVAEGVNVAQGFPVASPVFVLMSAAKSSVVIGIAGGQFSSGQQGLTIKKGQPVTLVNTADGARYVVELISVSTQVAELPQATGTTDTAGGLPPGPTAPTTITSTDTTSTTATTSTGSTTTTTG